MRSLLAWRAATAFLCCLLACAASGGQKPIRLRNQTIQPAPAEFRDSVKRDHARAPSSDKATGGLFLIQFTNQLEPEWRLLLQRSGIQPYIIEFSAGNAGPDWHTIGSPAVGKNVIATGASQSTRPGFFNYRSGPDAMADFSSRGPCEDGRIKPDVTAPVTLIASL